MNKKATSKRITQQTIGYSALSLLALVTVVPIIALGIFILVQGLSVINLEFLTGFPSDGMKAGGIFPAILGTIYLTLGTAIIFCPAGNCSCHLLIRICPG